MSDPTQTIPSTKKSSHLGTPEAKAKAKQTVTNLKVARVLMTEELTPGVKVYPDSAPGVGWVLDRKGYPKRYYATKELAVARYGELVASGA